MRNLNEKVTLANYLKGVIIGFEYKDDNKTGAVLMSDKPLKDRTDFLRYEILLDNGQTLFFVDSDIIETGSIKNYIVTTRTKYGLKQFRYYGLSSVEAVKKIHLKTEAMPERCIIDISEIKKPVKNNHAFGIVSKENGYIDTSNSLLGAKNHATRNGYKRVFKRFNGGYHVELASDKTCGFWVDSKDFKSFLNQSGHDDVKALKFTLKALSEGSTTLKECIR